MATPTQEQDDSHHKPTVDAQGDPRAGEQEEWEEALQNLTTDETDGQSMGDDDIDLSPQVQEKLKRLEEAVWHAPQGKGTRIVAMIILAGIALALIAMVVLIISSLT